jgi:hypothetical protein
MEKPLKDKPWRPGDHPRPGPSWGEDDRTDDADHRGVINAED